jgi:hypothetical protein
MVDYVKRACMACSRSAYAGRSGAGGDVLGMIGGLLAWWVDVKRGERGWAREEVDGVGRSGGGWLWAMMMVLLL